MFRRLPAAIHGHRIGIAVVLGLVSAGGIGLELKVVMDLFEYQRAAAIILMIFVLVVAVERAGALVRARIIRHR